MYTDYMSLHGFYMGFENANRLILLIKLGILHGLHGFGYIKSYIYVTRVYIHGVYIYLLYFLL